MNGINANYFTNFKNLQGMECIICLEDSFSDSWTGHEVIGSTGKATQHVFHTYCISVWLKQQINCPVCRLEMKNANLYLDRFSIHQSTLFLNACREGNENTIEILLKQNIYQNVLNDGLVCAAKNGKRKIVRLFLQRNLVSVSSKGAALKEAAGNGRDKVVRTLLKDGGTILFDDKIQAIKDSIVGTHVVSLQVLLIYVSPILPSERIGFLKIAVKRKNIVVIKKLLQILAYKKTEREEAVLLATQMGYIAGVKAILKHGPISNLTKALALRKAQNYQAAIAEKLRVCLN